LPLESKLKYSTGYGTSNGLSFILNAYQPDASKGKNFKLAVTNENDGFDFDLGYFMIEPGNRYTFSVAASQVITTDNFDKMPPGTYFTIFIIKFHPKKYNSHAPCKTDTRALHLQQQQLM
jgi:hypothetical protein